MQRRGGEWWGGAPLAASVGSGDEAVHACLDLKVEVANQHVAVGGHDRHVLEADDRYIG
jgi:hypothetical protein